MFSKNDESSSVIFRHDHEHLNLTSSNLSGDVLVYSNQTGLLEASRTAGRSRVVPPSDDDHSATKNTDQMIDHLNRRHRTGGDKT